MTWRAIGLICAAGAIMWAVAIWAAMAVLP